MLNRAAQRYGWRGLWLMVVGGMWVLFGCGVLQQPTEPRSWVVYEYVPALLQAGAWWATGLLAIWQGLRGAGRNDAPGHVALYLMPAVRLLSFLLAWMIYLACQAADALGCDAPDIGYSGGWYAALIWSLVSLMLALAASWPNPDPPLPRPPADALRLG